MNEKIKNGTQNIVTQAKEAAEKGNMRRVTLRTKEGKQLIETSLTVVVAAGVFLLVTGIVSWPVMLIGAFVGYKAQLQVEMTEADQHVSTRILESLQEDLSATDDESISSALVS